MFVQPWSSWIVRANSILWRVQNSSFKLYKFPQFPYYFLSFLIPNIFLNTLFLNTISYIFIWGRMAAFHIHCILFQWNKSGDQTCDVKDKRGKGSTYIRKYATCLWDKVDCPIHRFLSSVYTTESICRSHLQIQSKKIHNSAFQGGDLYVLTTVFIWDISTDTQYMKDMDALVEESHKKHFSKLDSFVLEIIFYGHKT
jgi:hypothetical protein